MKSSAAPAEQAEKSANPYNQGGQPVLPVPIARPENNAKKAVLNFLHYFRGLL